MVGVYSILLVPLMGRSIETIDVCIWGMLVFMSVVVIVWGSVGMFVVWCFSLGALKYAVRPDLHVIRTAYLLPNTHPTYHIQGTSQMRRYTTGSIMQLAHRKTSCNCEKKEA